MNTTLEPRPMRIAANGGRLLRALAALVAIAILAGCAGLEFWGRTKDRRTTSVVQYLYPDQKDPVASQEIPVLSLPMRVGVAFVPESPGSQSPVILSEAKKAALLEQAAAHFRPHDFIKSLEVIPTAYLTPRGGFTNLDQLATMYGIEAIALISYDQTQFTDAGVASMVYWTIVGAYLVSAEKNDTHTMVDAVVVHIPSRKLLFRAPGTSQVKNRSTPVNLSEELRHDSEEGLDQAVAVMIANLDRELGSFKERVKNAPQEYRVARAPGYTGGGAFDLLGAGVLTLLLGAGALWRRAGR